MRKLKNYPLNDTVKIDSIAHMIDLCVKDAGEKTAFMYKTGRNDSVHSVTYKEFSDDILALEKGMAKIGIKKTHISILSENSYKWINVFMSVLKSDSVFVPIDKELPFEDVLYVASHSDCRVLFFSAKFKKYIPEINKYRENFFVCGNMFENDLHVPLIMNIKNTNYKNRGLYNISIYSIKEIEEQTEIYLETIRKIKNLIYII